MRSSILLTAVLLTFGALSASANDSAADTEKPYTETATIGDTGIGKSGVSEEEFLSLHRPMRFTWGAELEGMVDMSGHDMSSLGINASFGFEWQWIRFLGVGAQADIAVSNSSRIYPVYVNFRTDFSRRRRLVFMDLRGGAAFANFYRIGNTTCGYFSGGLGVTLAAGRKFSSHIIVGYTWIGQRHCYEGDRLDKCSGLSYAQMRFGITF